MRLPRDSISAARAWQLSWRGFPSPRFRRYRTVQHGIAPGPENLVGKVGIAGNTSQHHCSHHGRDSRRRLFARGLAWDIGDLLGQHVDHLLQLG